MYKNKRIPALMVAVFLMASALFTGCGSKPADTSKSGSKEESKKETLEPVELTYYFVNSPQKDLATVNAELNKLVQPKINATLNLKLVDWGTYDQKMTMVQASAETYDLCFTSTWTNNYFQNVAKGAYICVDDLMDEYAPKTKKIVPEIFWKAARVKGKAYGVPNFQQATPGYGYLIQKPIADKYKIDWKSPKKFSDIEPFLEIVKKNEPDLIPYGYSRKDDVFLKATPMFGMEALGDSNTPGWIYLNDNSLKVVNQYETPEFKEYLNMMRRWYQKGYIRKDAATLKDMEEDKKAGKDAIEWGQIDMDTMDFEKAGMEYKGRMSISSPTTESYDYRFIKPVLTTDKAAATLTSISVTSKNKERAMMFIELLNTDKQIYNTLCWGVENKHYKKVADNRIETLKDGGYQLWSPWEFGFMGNSYLSEGDPKGGEVDNKFHKMWIDLNTNATPSPALGFTFDFTPVKSEKAQCDAIIDELYYSLSCGSVEPDKYLPTFIDKMKKAGSEKIIQEKQKQIDEWKEANGK